jgi:hypothetical protein
MGLYPQKHLGLGAAKLGPAVPLDVLDQDQDVGLLREQGMQDGGREGPRPDLMAEVERSDAHGNMMPQRAQQAPVAALPQSGVASVMVG